MINDVIYGLFGLCSLKQIAQCLIYFTLYLFIQELYTVVEQGKRQHPHPANTAYAH
jgi:hypothetical protein